MDGGEPFDGPLNRNTWEATLLHNDSILLLQELLFQASSILSVHWLMHKSSRKLQTMFEILGVKR